MTTYNHQRKAQQLSAHGVVEGRFGRENKTVASDSNDPLREQWQSLVAGDFVDLRLNGMSVHQGLVDARTSDGSIVWVTSTFGRRLFHEDDKFELVINERCTGTPEAFLDSPSSSASLSESSAGGGGHTG